MSIPQTPAPPAGSTPAGSRPATLSEALIQARLTYVWDWWKFHAKQRTDMFNYFLIITGILANAYIAILGNKISQPALARTLTAALGSGGAVTAVGFLLLDVRNRRQLERATAILQKIEAEQLRDAAAPLQLADVGGPSLFTHRVIFRAIEVIVGLGWLAVALGWVG